MSGSTSLPDVSVPPTKSNQTLILPAPPCCIARSAVTPGAVIVGTYDIDGQDASRSGSLCLLFPKVHPANPESHEYVLQERHSTASAVLDLNTDNQSHVFVANSTGGIEIWQQHLLPSDASPQVLVHCRTVQAFPSNILVLSLDRHPFSGLTNEHPTAPRSRDTIVSHRSNNVFAVSLSDGSVALVDCQYASPDALLWKIKAHGQEAWTIRWLPQLNWPSHQSRAWTDSDLLISGGDDSHFRLHTTPVHPGDSDIDPGSENPIAMAPWWTDRRTHGAGVTAILPLASLGWVRMHNIVLTGSYDDKIRVMDMSVQYSPHGAFSPGFKCLAELNVGGGVWRLSVIGDGQMSVNRRCFWVLASCMYVGCKILEIITPPPDARVQAPWQIKVVAKMEEHNSMNYASVWIPNEGNQDVSETPDQYCLRVGVPPEAKTCSDDDLKAMLTITNSRIISTSFYDKRFCVWKPDLPIPKY